MKVRYTLQAKADLGEIFSYVAKDNPAAASRLIARIRHHVVALSNNPALGRSGRIAGTRKKMQVIAVEEVDVSRLSRPFTHSSERQFMQSADFLQHKRDLIRIGVPYGKGATGG